MYKINVCYSRFLIARMNYVLSMHSDGSSSWSPIKLNRKAVKSASAESSDCDLDVSAECLYRDVQLRGNVSGVEIETHGMMKAFGCQFPFELVPAS